MGSEIGSEIGSWFTHWCRGNNKYCHSPGWGGPIAHLQPEEIIDGIFRAKFSISGKVQEIEIPVAELETPIWSLKMCISEYFWDHEEKYMTDAGWERTEKFWSQRQS